jgi:folate-dependent phosphoribosylglycinamide formyltransferase PurN
MRVVIVTGTAPHHKNLCAKIAQSYEVVGIIHPSEPNNSKWHGLKRYASRDELLLGIHHALGKVIGKRRGTHRSEPGTTDAQNGAKEYLHIAESLIHSSCDVNATETHALLQRLRPDVTVCLGGPIYPKAFLRCSPIMLNFHSGISPIYNGAASTHFAFANGHPHLCGGTLMVMGAGVDNGSILGHYFPAIEPGDTPEILFQKTADGAVGMYDRLLCGLRQEPRQLISIPQPRPLFYTRGIELGWYHDAMIARHQRRNLIARFSRPEKVVEYWQAPDRSTALQIYRETIDALLWGQFSPANS